MIEADKINTTTDKICGVLDKLGAVPSRTIRQEACVHIYFLPDIPAQGYAYIALYDDGEVNLVRVMPPASGVIYSEPEVRSFTTADAEGVEFRMAVIEILRKLDLLE